MILTLFTKLQSVTLEHLDRAEEVLLLLVMLGQFSRSFNEIIDTITQHTQTRFSDFVKNRFLDLLDSSKSREYQKTFPEQSFKCLLDTNGFAFDEILLKNQLIFLYSLTEFQGKFPTEMLQFFSNNPASKAALSQVALQFDCCYSCFNFMRWKIVFFLKTYQIILSQ